MKTLYKTQGTCCQAIEVETGDDGRITSCHFHGGCPGNTQGVARLVVGMQPAEVIRLLNGTLCRDKQTSCPDQLCRALEQLQ